MTQNIIKGTEVIGLKVITLEKGQNINVVHELVYDPQDHEVKALIVDEGGWFSDAKVILFEDIEKIGKDVIIVSSDQVVKKASDVQKRITRIVKADNFLTEDKIITEDGTELGQVSDIYFDSTTGKVIELEVSQGLKNFKSGKKRVKIADIIKVGKDATIVRAYVEDDLEQQAQKQGVQGAVNSARQQAPSVIDQVKAKAQEVGQLAQDKVREVKDLPKTKELLQTVKDKTSQLTDTTKQKVQETKEKTDQDKRKNALGKYVTINILSANDQILAKRGDMITNAVLSSAEGEGMLEQVYSNISSEPLVSADQSKKNSQNVEIDMKVKGDGKVEKL